MYIWESSNNNRFPRNWLQFYHHSGVSNLCHLGFSENPPTQLSIYLQTYIRYPETNNPLENEWLEDIILSFQEGLFSRALAVSFREGKARILPIVALVQVDLPPPTSASRLLWDCKMPKGFHCSLRQGLTPPSPPKRTKTTFKIKPFWKIHYLLDNLV